MSAQSGSQQSPATVTFLFTDIEGSTRLAQEHADVWDSLQDQHHSILQSVMEAHGGHVFQVIGDAFCVAFESAQAAVRAAVEAQRRLQTYEWGETPVRVRMGLHAGAAVRNADRYRGYLTMARVQRVMSAAHGGQILLSSAGAEALAGSLADDLQLLDLSEHHLKGFAEVEHLWQVSAPGLQQDFPPLATLKRLAGNLPLQATSFIGRQKELAETAELLGKARLLTLTGSGGTGKTRLSLQLGEHVQGRFKDGVWLIELAPINEPGLVASTISSVLGLQEEPGRTTLQTLAEWLRDKELLLILDNCEHLIQVCAEISEAILRASATTRLLATSREALAIGGETTYRVPPLQIPVLDAESRMHEIRGIASVQLFVERASEASAAFKLTEANAGAVARICARLDGIPLALELAAARVPALSIDDIAGRLDDRFRLLTRGSRTALAHHQTLRAMIDWSYELLSETERVLLSRLSVFAGGCTMEAAEQICGEDQPGLDVLNTLTNLVDKSLVVLEETEAGSRYHLLETTRQYALEKLVEAGQDRVLRDRHLSFFLALAETAEGHLRDASQLVWLDRLQAELNNLRAALEWALESRSYAAGLRLATALHWFWNLRSLLSEGHEWLARTLKPPDGTSQPPELRARALYRLAHFAHYLGEPMAERRALFEESLALNKQLGIAEGCGHTLVMLTWITPDPQEAERLYAEAMEYARKSDNPWVVPATYMNMADLMVDTGQQDRALEYLGECIPQFRALGDRWGIAWSLLLLAYVKRQTRDYSAAAELLGESMTLFRELQFNVGVRLVVSASAELEFTKGNYEAAVEMFEENLTLARSMGLRNAIAGGLLRLGTALCRRGDYERAVSLLAESIRSFQERGHLSEIPVCLTTLAQAHAASGRPEIAARLLGAAEAQATVLGRPLVPAGVLDRDFAYQTVRERLAAPVFERELEEGRHLTLDEAIALSTDRGAG